MRIHGNIHTDATNQVASTFQDTGVADAYVVDLRPSVITGLTVGLTLKFVVNETNTGPSTMVNDGSAAAAIKKDVTADLVANDLLAGEIVTVTYDGTNWQLMGARFAPIQNGVVFGGQVSYIGPGFTYRIQAAGYYINFQYHTSPTTDVVLDPADLVDDRFDTFIVDNLGVASVLTGIPDPNPSEPSIDLGTQLRLSATLVTANTTEPTIASECMYLENTEWIAATTGAPRITLASTSNPHFGIKDIEGTLVNNNDVITLTRGAGVFAPYNTYNTLQMWIRAKAGFTGSSRLVLQWRNGTTLVGNSVTISSGTWGFTGANTTQYQLVALPLTVFGLTNVSNVTNLRITVLRTLAFGFYIDDVCLIEDPDNTSNLIPKFQNGVIYNSATNIAEFGTNPLLHNTTLNTALFIQTFAQGTVYEYGYQFQGNQTFQNGTAITSFIKTGSSDPLALDYQHGVRLGFNYTGNIYSGSPTTLNGYMGPDDLGYWLGVNGQGHGSFGIYTDNADSKTGGIFIHTMDGSIHEDMVTIFGKSGPTANSAISIQPGQLGFAPYKIATFKNTKEVQFFGYGEGAFFGGYENFAAFDIDGNIVEVPYSDVVADPTRFAVLDEDDIANEARLFDMNAHDFIYTGAGTLAVGTESPNVGFKTHIETTSLYGGALIQKVSEVHSDADTGVGVDGRFMLATSASDPNYNGSSPVVGLYGELGFTGGNDFNFIGGGNYYTQMSGLSAVVTQYQNSGNLNSGDSIFAGGVYHLHVAGTGNIDKFTAIRAMNPIQTPEQDGWTGLMDTHYGIFIDDITNSGFEGQITKKYGVFQEGLTEDNFFGGAMHLQSLATTGSAPSQSGTVKMVVTDADGLLSFADIPSGGGGGASLFGFPGDDDTAGEERAFDLNTHSFAYTANHDGAAITINQNGTLGTALQIASNEIALNVFGGTAGDADDIGVNSVATTPFYATPTAGGYGLHVDGVANPGAITGVYATDGPSTAVLVFPNFASVYGQNTNSRVGAFNYLSSSPAAASENVALWAQTTVPEVGFGTKINFSLTALDTPFPSLVTSNEIISRWTNPDWGGGTATAELVIVGTHNDVGTDLLTLSGDGQARLNQYGTGIFPGGVGKTLMVNGIGELKEVTPLVYKVVDHTTHSMNPSVYYITESIDVNDFIADGVALIGSFSFHINIVSGSLITAFIFMDEVDVLSLTGEFYLNIEYRYVYNAANTTWYGSTVITNSATNVPITRTNTGPLNAGFIDLEFQMFASGTSSLSSYSGFVTMLPA